MQRSGWQSLLALFAIIVLALASFSQATAITPAKADGVVMYGISGNNTWALFDYYNSTDNSLSNMTAAGSEWNTP